MHPDIPTEGRIPLLDITIPIHWENHAMLMFGVWFVLVPAAIMLVRFGKGKPSTYGIPRGTPKYRFPELSYAFHFYALYTAIFLAVGGAAFAMLLTGGFSGTLHAWFGAATILLGVLQIVSGWFRGTHGGRKDKAADPDDRSTWGGDHFDMTPQRWWFEAWHKTNGYFALVMAVGAVATGLSQYWLPLIALAFGLVIALGLVAAVLLQGLGFKQDTYQTVYGTHPEHPFNKRRYQAMLDAQGEKP